MVKKPQYTSAAVRSVFCLDGVENYDFKGRLYIGMEKQGYAVSCMADFVKILENVFDYCNFPQASHEIRSFFGVKRNNDEKRMAFMEEKKIASQPEPKGDKATFIVQVQFRQNATWQGTVQWVEKGVTQRFRSELELMKLMGEASESDELASWKS